MFFFAFFAYNFIISKFFNILNLIFFKSQSLMNNETKNKMTLIPSA